jgi:hypothetical protein
VCTPEPTHGLSGGVSYALEVIEIGSPRILQAEEPHLVVWSSLWPSRPHDEVHFELEAIGTETSLRFRLLTPDEAPDESKTGHLRHRLNHLLFADLRFSYGQ